MPCHLECRWKRLHKTKNTNAACKSMPFKSECPTPSCRIQRWNLGNICIVTPTFAHIEYLWYYISWYHLIKYASLMTCRLFLYHVRNLVLCLWNVIHIIINILETQNKKTNDEHASRVMSRWHSLMINHTELDTILWHACCFHNK